MKINGIPIKIRTKEEMDMILNRDSNQGKGGQIFFIGAIGNKKTGKIVEIHKIDHKTNKKTILFRDENDELFKKKNELRD